ncbi:MAG: Fe-only nitrogenase subunit delta [Zymomonas mobilis]|nr:Fe-only nitrogenase subunit delta [Zymomonas mobilis]
MMQETIENKVGDLLSFIMKNSLWQFNSRGWDRRKQSEGVLTKVSELLCDEPVSKETPADKCYYAEAQCVVDGFNKNFPWLKDLSKDEIKALIHQLHERLDYQTIDASLNAELTVKNY